MKYLAFSIILTLTVIFSSGCALITEAERAPSPSDGSPAPVTGLPATGGNITVNPEWTSPEESKRSVALPSIADVVARVKPSVVAINTEITSVDFFNRPFTQGGAGSGWIISEDGYIVTNNHVIENAGTITVTLDDGRTVPATVVGVDILTDLAVIKIDAGDLLAVTVGAPERLRVGDWVVAIGNSLGRGIRATQGIVSLQGASIQVEASQILYGLIETDAAINPGNSGGPLVNMAGEVIGITSAKYAEVGVEGVGYAISTETAMPVIEQLITSGVAVHPWLGVSVFTVNQMVVEEFNLAVEEGAFVTEVIPDSPAGKAGLTAEDVITGFAGKDITSADDLIIAIRSARVGEEVEITFWRDNTANTTHATLTERPVP